MKVLKQTLSVIVAIVAIVMISSCSQIKYGDVFELTDNFAEKLTTTYQHYDMLGQHAEQTKDKE